MGVGIVGRSAGRRVGQVIGRWTVQRGLLGAGLAAAAAMGPALAQPCALHAQEVRGAPPPGRETALAGDRAAAESGATGRVPVLLVPGWSHADDDLAPLERRFLDQGWPPERVVAVEFQDPVGSNVDHAQEIARALDRLLAATGAPRADVVAHSMGGLATRYLLQNGDPERVRRVVFMATPHRGTLTSYLAWGEGGREMHPGSLFLLELQRLRGVPPGVEALTVRTRVDFHILPPESATLVGVPDVEVCCPGHVGLLDHDEAFDAIHRFLTRTP